MVRLHPRDEWWRDKGISRDEQWNFARDEQWNGNKIPIFKGRALRRSPYLYPTSENLTRISWEVNPDEFAFHPRDVTRSDFVAISAS
jgi:hypothetical protein